MTICPRCGGDCIVVLARSFCAKTYADGGCGTNWVRRRGEWRDDGTRPCDRHQQTSMFQENDR